MTHAFADFDPRSVLGALYEGRKVPTGWADAQWDVYPDLLTDGWTLVLSVRNGVFGLGMRVARRTWYFAGAEVLRKCEPGDLVRSMDVAMTAMLDSFEFPAFRIWKPRPKQFKRRAT